MIFFGSVHSSGSNSESSSSENGDDDDGSPKKDDEIIIDKHEPTPPSMAQGALAQIGVPEHFPEVPVLPVLRNPVFPKFVKLVEVGAHFETSEWPLFKFMFENEVLDTKL